MLALDLENTFCFPLHNNGDAYKGINIDPPKFGTNLESIVEQAYLAIDAVLNHEENDAINLASITGRRKNQGDSSWRHSQNRGRIGIEIDGIRSLLSSYSKSQFLARLYKQRLELGAVHSNCLQNDIKKRQVHKVIRASEIGDVDQGLMNVEMDIVKDDDDNRLEEFGLRTFALMLASRLSVRTGNKRSVDDDNTEVSNNIPIALYFRNLELTLFASSELKLLRDASDGKDVYDNISVCSLQNDNLPKSFLKKDLSALSEKERRRYLSSEGINADNGIAIVVNPLNRDLESLQRIAVMTATSCIPLIVISPRLETGFETEAGDELASSYGGAEPARHPWLLKDFLPPIFAWITDATVESIKSPTISLMRSVSNSDSAWHLFHSTLSRIPLNKYDDEASKSVNFQSNYIASIPASTGRPNTEMMLLLWKDWRNRIKGRKLFGE